MSFCCVFGVSYVIGEGWAAIPLGAEILLTLVGIIPFGAVLVLFAAGYDRLAPRAPRTPRAPHPRRTPGRLHRLRRPLPWPALMAVMLVFWLPWVVANFPGGTYWDTYWQMWQVYPEAHPVPLIQWPDVQDETLTTAWLVDHHPVLTTLVYGAAAWVSDQLTGTWMAGVFVLATLQVLAYAALFAHAIVRFRAWRVPLPLRAAAFALFCLLPSFPVWADCVVKDSTFGLFFFPWLMMLADCARTRGASLANKHAQMGMFALALLMCLTKKTGVFVVVATAIVCCLVFRTRRTKQRTKQGGGQRVEHRAKERTAFAAFALQGVGCFVVMALLLPLLVFPLANIAPGGRQEVLGPLFQQTSRYAQAHALTDEEAAIIDAVVDGERVRDHYDADFQDAVKYYYRVDATDADLARYLGLWVQQGMRDPEAYFGSVAALAGQYLAPTTYLNLRMVTVDTKLGEDQRYVLWNPDELDWLRQGLDEAYKAVASIPVVNLPFLTVTYALWLPCLMAFACWRRRSLCGILFVPLAVVVAFCVVAPVFDARYAWPLLLAAPVLWCAPAASSAKRYTVTHAATAQHIFTSTASGGGPARIHLERAVRHPHGGELLPVHGRVHVEHHAARLR